MYFEPAGIIVGEEIEFVSQNQLKFTITISPDAGLRSYDLRITGPDGLTGFLPLCFTVEDPPNPVINSVVPQNIFAGETSVLVSIFGLDLDSTSTVDFGDGVYIDRIDFISENQVDVMPE